LNSVSTPQAARIRPVILSGGSGTRLWPLSRSARPKQLLSLVGTRTMLQTTLDRVCDATRFDTPILVASVPQAELIEQQLAATHAAASRLILEPSARNTAPAITLAALTAEPDELLLVMPSDHLIGDAPAFEAAVARGAPLAQEGWLVTFGCRPNRAETGYGYIKQGRELAPDAFQVDRFVEKPDETRAAAYVADGGYHWNAGIFLFRADAFLAAMAAHAPEALAACRRAVKEGETRGRRFYPSPAAFASAPGISVDHGVMEHADRIAVVPMQVQWSDVGSWQSLYEISPTDAQGNAVSGDAALVRASGCLVRSEGPLVVAVGVENLAIIVTGDAVLVIPRSDSQAVRDAVELLKERGDPRL
jgi:mannose-1-phosphate guanylyltransferase/mannose-1-phosphate guanylyltransferase/mannose-6-phosphate isomerase